MTQALFFVSLIVVVLIVPVIPLLFGCACILLGPLVAFFVIQTCFRKANNLLRSHRDVFLIRYKSHLFPSHWVLFVPNRAGRHINGKNAGPGKVINVEGDVNEGFNLFFKRNYNPVKTSRTMEAVFLASIDDALVVNPTDSSFYPEEHQALPRANCSLRPSTWQDSRNQGCKGKPINHNCQWWTKEYVRALVAAGIMPTEALAILDNVP